MKEGLELKRLRYVKFSLYGTIFLSFVLLLITGASSFGYGKPEIEVLGMLGALIGVQLSSAILMLIQDLEGKPFKEVLSFNKNVIIGLASSLLIGALLMWIFLD